jgi:hypothetical protein
VGSQFRPLEPWNSHSEYTPFRLFLGYGQLRNINKKPIFHNAGATHPATPPDNIFYKGEWIDKSPIGVDLPLPKEGSASRKYVEAILSVKP